MRVPWCKCPGVCLVSASGCGGPNTAANVLGAIHYNLLYDCAIVAVNGLVHILSW